MKSKSFLLQPELFDFSPDVVRVIRIRVPTLPAYAIEFADLIPPTNLETGYEPPIEGIDFTIDGDEVIWRGHRLLGILNSAHGIFRLIVHYHGIRDYKALFPFVSDEALRTRLGEFYEEAETVFENGAWLSFSLMCGAIYEGLLTAHPNVAGDSFAEMIRNAEENETLTKEDVALMEFARKCRNLIHASKSNLPNVTRIKAMDLRISMDKLIQAFAHSL